MFGSGTTERLNDWDELAFAAAEHAEAVRRGKVPVILTYLDPKLPDRRGAALYTYAYARLCGFLWADWYTLKDSDADQATAHSLYRVRLGKPLGDAKIIGDLHWRAFEKGLVVLNPTTYPVSIAIPAANWSALEDIGHGRVLRPENGKLRLDMQPESGRVLCVLQSHP
jgi:hypothetical protein